MKLTSITLNRKDFSIKTFKLENGQADDTRKAIAKTCYDCIKRHNLEVTR